MSTMKKYEGDRRVSFLDKEAARWLCEEAPAIEDGLCLGRFHADLEAEGVKYYNPTENGSEGSFKKFLESLEKSYAGSGDKKG